MMKTKLLIGAICISVIGAVFFLQHLQIAKLEKANNILIEQNGQLDLSLKIQDTTIMQMGSNLDSVIKSTTRLAMQINQAEAERQAITNQLNGFRGRLNNVAIKKPGLIESRANTAFADVLRDFAAATGSTSTADTD